MSKGWRVVYTKQAQKGARRLDRSGLRPRAERLVAISARDPFETPPPFEKLLGDLAGAYSRRINIQRRLVCQVLEDIRTAEVIRMWTQYEQLSEFLSRPSILQGGEGKGEKV